MQAQWNVGLSGGYEVSVRADEAAVNDGALTLIRRTESGEAFVAMSLGRGEWTSLAAEIGPTGESDAAMAAMCAAIDARADRLMEHAAHLGSRMDDLVGPSRGGADPSSPFFSRPDLHEFERRRVTDRRRPSSKAWTGPERRTGAERRRPVDLAALGWQVIK